MFGERCHEVGVGVETPYPTAQASSALVAATLVRLASAPLGLGLFTRFQWDPFQCSVTVTSGPLEGNSLPTANTSSVPTAVTELSSAELFLKLGVRTDFHRWPSQCSAYVFSSDASLTYAPTAHTSFAEIAETPVSTEYTEEFGALGTTDHTEPSQCSTPGVEEPESASVMFPTAQTSSAETASTFFQATVVLLGTVHDGPVRSVPVFDKGPCAAAI